MFERLENIQKKYEELKIELTKPEVLNDYNKLKNEYRKVRDTIDTASETSSGSTSNLDLLRRISNLEKIVYGRDN